MQKDSKNVLMYITAHDSRQQKYNLSGYGCWTELICLSSLPSSLFSPIDSPELPNEVKVKNKEDNWSIIEEDQKSRATLDGRD